MTVDGVWLHAAIGNAGERPTSTVLSLGKPYMAAASAYVLREGGVLRVLHGGDHVPFRERVAPTRVLASEPFALEPGETADLFVFYAVDGRAALDPILFTETDYLETRSAQALVLAMFYSASAMLGVFLIVFAAVLRTTVVIAYTVFYVALTLYSAQLDGLLFRFLWPGWPGWNALASHPIGLIAVIAALATARAFVDAGRTFPWFDRIVVVLMATAAALVFAPVLAPLATVKVWAGFLILALLACHLTAALLAALIGRPGWRFYLAGSLLLMGYIGFFTANAQFGITLPGASVGDVMRAGQFVDGSVFAAAAILQTLQLRRREREATALAERRRLELAAARHDMRQPLAALRLQVRALRDADDPRSSEASRVLEESLAYFEGVIGRERRAGPAPGAGLPAGVVLKGIETMFAGEAETAGIDLRVVPSSARIAADPVVLTRCLANLVSNALLHADCRAIVVGVRRLGATVRFEVWDDGRGITAEEMAAVGPSERGEGIGLHHTRSLATAHGWAFSHAGRPGRGSTFRIADVPLQGA